MDSSRLRDRAVVVTGASSGIGEATAIAFAAAGAKVVLAARRGERLRAIAGRIEENRLPPTPIRSCRAEFELADNAVETRLRRCLDGRISTGSMLLDANGW